MLGNYRVASQLVTSQVVLSSIELVRSFVDENIIVKRRVNIILSVCFISNYKIK
jgi:hypothetical protein